jgi:tetratricopeptide (TPR) repeat protein
MLYHKYNKYLLIIIIISVIKIYSQDFSFNVSKENLNIKELNSSELWELSQKSFKEGYYYYSIQYLTEYLQRNPNQLDAMKLLIKSYININDYRRSEQIIQNGLNQYPEDSFFEIYLSLIELKKGNIDKAKNMIEKLEEKVLQNQDFYFIKGIYYFNLNQYNLSEFYFKKFLSYQPDNHNIYIYLFENYLKVNQLDNALYYKNQFQKVFPNNIMIYKMNGDYYYKLYLNENQNNNFLKIQNLKEAYINYKTYLNYTQFDPEIWNHLLNIAYLLNDKEKIQSLIENESSYIKDHLISSNVYQILNHKNLLNSLQNLCSENKIFFACIRYDFFIKNNQKHLQNERSKYYLNYAKNNKEKIHPDEYYNILLWAKSLNPDNLELLKEFLNYYKENEYYEDYFFTLQNLIIKEPENPYWKLLMERFMQQKKQYLMFDLFSNIPLLNIKSYYKRKKINILVFNPYPIDKYEHHLKESDLFRDFINFYINNIEILNTISNEQWQEIKLKTFNNEKFYLFYKPEILPIIKEWETENNYYFDYFLEINYKMINNKILIYFILRDKNGINVTENKEYQISLNQLWKLTKFLKEFLLNNINLQGIYLTSYKNDLVLNLGKIDKIKINDIFKYQNNYYRVKNVYTYTSLIELIKGNPIVPPPNEVFIKANR